MPLDRAPLTRQFSVHACREARDRAHLLEGVSFEDAALRFVEVFHPAAGADHEIELIVEDCASGERQCFRIDVDTGESVPCD
jgi:hypothetical protein